MLILSTILLILSNAVNTIRDSLNLYSRILVISLIYTCILIILNTYISFFFNGISLYNGLFKTSNYIVISHLFLITLSILIISISSSNKNKNLLDNQIIDNNSKLNKQDIIEEDLAKQIIDNNNLTLNKNTINEKNKIEYPLLILFCIIGGIFLISSSDLISMFLSIELQSYALYLICSIYRNSENSVSAGLTYFLLGGLSSCIILLGQGLLYVNTGTTNLESIYIIKNIYESLVEENTNYILYNLNSIQYSLILLSIGLLFKVSSAPFHFWSPDVYDAIPTIVTTFVAIIAKISILFFLLELVYYTNSNSIQFNWINNLMLSSILSLIIGSVLGLTQYRIKRLYAYSTISHIGFLLLAISINNVESIQAFIFYLIQYSISNLNAFIILIAIGYTLYNYEWNDNTISYRNLKEINNSPIQLISQLKGYFKINPFISISLAITLFSFIGVPPLIGFFAKQKILISALDNGYIFIVLIAILTSVISAVYYLIIVKFIFFEPKVYNIYISSGSLHYSNIPSTISLIISLITIIILIFILLNSILDEIIYIII
jgi:NADH-ubiquinone oxidoreductase chain 2